MKMTIKMFGEERELTLVEDVSDLRIGNVVDATCGLIVDDGDNYRPWMKDFFVNVGLYSLFVEESIPEGHTDEEVTGFFEGDEWRRLRASFPAEKVNKYEKWVNEKTDVLVDLYFRSGANVAVQIVNGIMELLKERKERLDRQKEEKVE